MLPIKKNPKLIRSEMYTFVLSFCPNYLLYTYSIDLYVYTCSSSSETHNVERNEAQYLRTVGFCNNAYKVHS